MKDKILKVIADYLDVPESELGPERTLEDLGVDSLDFIEIVFEVEEHLGIEIPDDAGELRDRIHTIGDVIQLATELQEQKA